MQEKNRMRVLIYKRTHKGDPDENGNFGIHDCMGRIRDWNYDAVIGIGGKTTWKGHNIKCKINWIGLEPRKAFLHKSGRGHVILFAHFKLYEEAGENIEEHYPNLFDYMYKSRKRFDFSSNLPENVYKEVMQILNSIKDCPASKCYSIEDEELLKKCVFPNNSESEYGECSKEEKVATTCRK